MNHTTSLHFVILLCLYKRHSATEKKQSWRKKKLDHHDYWPPCNQLCSYIYPARRFVLVRHHMWMWCASVLSFIEFIAILSQIGKWSSREWLCCRCDWLLDSADNMLALFPPQLSCIGNWVNVRSTSGCIAVSVTSLALCRPLLRVRTRVGLFSSVMQRLFSRLFDVDDTVDEASPQCYFSQNLTVH